jgi:hypothetical protein
MKARVTLECMCNPFPMLRCQKSVIYRSESSLYTSHFFAATIVSFWLSVFQANAQSRETAFGQTLTVTVPGKFDRFSLTTGSRGGSVLYFWSERSATIGSGSLDSAGKLIDWRLQTLSAPVDEFMVVDFTAEHKQFGVGVDRVQHLLTFYDHLDADTLRSSSTLQLPISAGRIVFGDLNNDGKTDFVVFDRETPGIIPFFGLGNNRFREGKPFALDNAVEDLQLVNLNNDNLVDIVFYDWVRSEVHLLYGVGQGKFLDQAAIRVDGTVRQLVATPLMGRGNVDLILSCSNPARIEILEGNGMGEFKPGYRISLKERLTSIFVTDINGDGAKDIVGWDRASMLRVYLNGGDNTFDDRLDFTGNRGVGEMALSKTAKPGVLDAVLFDKDSQKLVWLMNAMYHSELIDSLDLSTGARPRGIAIGDINGDGLNDVLVATAGSSSLSLYFNRPGWGLMGQTAYALPASAHDIAFHSLRDSVARILISHPESKQLSLFSLDLRERSGINASIGTERAVEFLYCNTARTPAVDFFCFGPSVAATPASLTLFQEIESHQFIERNFTLSPNNTLLGAGVGRLNRDSIPDVAFVYRNNTSGKYQLAVSLGDTLYSFRQKTDLVELPQKNLSRSYIWIVDLDNDGRQDILMLNDGPISVLERVRHLRDNFYTPIDTIGLDVQISDWAQIQFCDLDGDGNIDLIVNDVDKGQIGWFRGHGSSFEGFRALVSIPRRSHFALGDLNNDGTPDLAVTFGDQGIIRIYNGKFLLRQDRETIH